MAGVNLDKARERGGRALVEALEAKGVHFAAAFWAYRQDINEWRLNLVTPQVKSKGPRYLHKTTMLEIQKMNGSGEILPYEIDFYSPENPFIAYLAASIPVSLSGKHRSTFNDVVNVSGNKEIALGSIETYIFNTHEILQFDDISILQ